MVLRVMSAHKEELEQLVQMALQVTMDSLASLARKEILDLKD